MIADAPTLGLGLALLAAGLDWRVRAIRRRRADFRSRARAALDDQDPATRRAAVAVVAKQGLSAVAELLLEAIRRERDGSVLDAIAEAVARNQWEPSHRPEVFELRLWAQSWLEQGAQRQREEAVALEQRAQRQREESVALEQLYTSTPSPRASDSYEPVVSNGHGPQTISQASRPRALALLAAGGWRRLRVARTSPAERHRKDEGWR
jgi:hypothetical protein